MQLTQLISYVRDLTGVYSTDLLPDALVSRWLTESNNEINRAYDWPWTVGQDSGTIVTGSSTITLTNATSRIKQFVLIQTNGTITQVIDRKGLIQTDEGDDGFFYDITDGGVITLSKPVTENLTYKITYVKASVALNATPGAKASLIPDEFDSVLCYRTSLKVLASQSDDSQRTQAYANELMAMLETMQIVYIIEDDLGPIQIGGEILRLDGRTEGRLNLRYRGI